MENETLLFTFGAMILFGLGGFLVKYALSDIELITIYLGELVVALFALLIFILIKKPELGIPDMTAANYAVVFIIGVLFFTSVMLMYHALRKGDASIVIPIINLNTVVVVILAVLILKEKLTVTSSAGIMLSVVAIYLLSKS